MLLLSCDNETQICDKVHLLSMQRTCYEPNMNLKVVLLTCIGCKTKITNTNEGWFMLSTMKSSQGTIRALIGCWIPPGTTQPWSWGFQKTYFKAYWYTNMVQWVLWWERQERWYGRKKQGPMAKKCCYNTFLMNFFGGFYIQLFPLGKVHKGHFSASIWYNGSWEASPPSMCCNHIIANETYHYFHALPLKLAPTCFIKQCGTSRAQEFEYTWCTFQIMLNDQHKVHIICKLHITCTN